MNITEMLGAPVNDEADPEPSRHSACTPPAPIESGTQPRHRSRRLLASLAVATALIIGAAGGWYLASATDVEPVDLTTPSPAETIPPHVGDFAAMFTAIYLSGTASSDDLGAMYTGAAPTATDTWVNQSAAVSAEPLGDGFWEVTVAVDSLELVDAAYESAGIQYFELTVSEQARYPIVVAAPARIPTPISATDSSVPSFADAVPADQARAVTHFINGYLTGEEDIARYVTPTARIRLFAQPPYESISITSMGSDSLGNVLTSVTATTPRGATHALGYALELSFESGVWEVSSLASVVNAR